MRCQFCVVLLLLPCVALASVIEGRSVYKKTPTNIQVEQRSSNQNHETEQYKDIASAVVQKYNTNQAAEAPISQNSSSNITIDNEGRKVAPPPPKNITLKVADPNKPSDYKAATQMDLAYEAISNDDVGIALKHYQSALKEKSNSTEAMFGIATCQHLMGNKSEATKTYLQILETKPRHAGAIHNLMLLLAEEDMQAAIETLTEISRHSRVDPVLLLQLGILLAQAEEYSKAVRCFKMSLALDPHNPIAMYNLATTLEATGNKSIAVELYKQTLQNVKAEHAKVLDVNGIRERIKSLS